MTTSPWSGFLIARQSAEGPDAEKVDPRVTAEAVTDDV
jgi:hypothetical protein